MKFNIGSIVFEISARRNGLVEKLKQIYDNNINNRVATIREYRKETGVSLRDGIDFCNEFVFRPEDRVKI